VDIKFISPPFNGSVPSEGDLRTESFTLPLSVSLSRGSEETVSVCNA